MAKFIVISVLFGRRNLAGPLHFSMLLMPVMVVMGRLDLYICSKYLLSLNIVWDVPLSRIHMFSSEVDLLEAEARWVSRDRDELLYFVRSSSILR